ncbi:MAG: branched-chain amino acid ABC transporter permease [Candidatus Woesearchaeota archaeon]
MIFVQLLFNSLIIGSIYALVASGFSMIYGTNRFIHFAHGSSVAAAGYIMFLLFVILGIPFWASIPLTILAASGLGYLMFVGIYAPMRQRHSSNVVLLIASVGILILVENLILMLFGADVKSIQRFPLHGISVFGAIITPLQLVIFIVSIAILVGLFLMMKRTALGRHMRAVADNPELARIMGVNSRRIQGYSFLIGSALAGVAGILIGLEQNLEPTMGTMLMVKGFTGAVIGGVTSIPASVVGSYLLGLAENYGIWYLPSGYKDAIAFGLLFIFLLFRPTGIFGINKGGVKT